MCVSPAPTFQAPSPLLRAEHVPSPLGTPQFSFSWPPVGGRQLQRHTTLWQVAATLGASQASIVKNFNSEQNDEAAYLEFNDQDHSLGENTWTKDFSRTGWPQFDSCLWCCPGVPAGVPFGKGSLGMFPGLSEPWFPT